MRVNYKRKLPAGSHSARQPAAASRNARSEL